MKQNVVSFMLRFIRESEAEEARWRGMIQHVQGHKEQPFTQFSQALTFMQEHVNETIRATFDDTTPPPQDFNPFLETTKLWGEFMPQYQQMVLDAMEQAKNHFPIQMENMMQGVMQLWGMAPPAFSDAGAETAALKAEVKRLQNQVAQLEQALADR